MKYDNKILQAAVIWGFNGDQEIQDPASRLQILVTKNRNEGVLGFPGTKSYKSIIRINNIFNKRKRITMNKNTRLIFLQMDKTLI